MKNKIYAIRNPIWLADKFIFSKMTYEDENGKKRNSLSVYSYKL